MIVWVQLPALKVHFYHKEVLTTLGNLIGRTIKLDYHTLTRQRAKFARLAVEVDLSRPLVPRIWLDDEWQKVEFENLPVVCFECGKIGHSTDSCPLLHPTVSPAALPLPGGTSTETRPESPEENPGYGPWMLVSRKSRRNPRDQGQKGKQDNETGILGTGKDGKNSKGGNRNKEGNASPSYPATSNGSLVPTLISQEKKSFNGRKGGGEMKKGKEKVGSQENPKEQSLLGPRPNVTTKPGQVPIMAIETQKAQASTSAQNIKTAKPKDIKVAGQEDVSAQKINPQPSAHPPLVHSVIGPSGTKMQSIAVPPADAISTGGNGEAIPSTASRTKRAKNAKPGGRKGSPAKLNPTRTLQIWSPVKEKKSKNKARLASLTLQDINAWTEARGRPASGLSDQAAMEETSQRPGEETVESEMATSA
ncbi:unnamed protein product [Linum tenue]|uniref:CCHC-type domain-containing protein n=1 Tax=Linum tenue TaxID=586396 RepID=A0AAV0LVM7_9ROSI|nr:unnamed protein product [Linum tenue]